MKKEKAKEVEKDAEHYKRVLMKVALVTKCRESYDICVGELGIKSADELRRKAKREGLIDIMYKGANWRVGGSWLCASKRDCDLFKRGVCDCDGTV